MNTCLYCGKDLIRKENERKRDFEVKKYCSIMCVNLSRRKTNKYEIFGDKAYIYSEYRNEIKAIIIDKVDLEKVLSMPNKWRIYVSKSGGYYSRAYIPSLGKKQKSVFIHHYILPPKQGYVIDHIDRNGLNLKKFSTEKKKHIKQLKIKRELGHEHPKFERHQ